MLFASSLISSDELEEQLNEPNLRIVDCSVAGQPNKDGSYTFISQAEQWEKEHIPNSIHVDIPLQLSDQEHEVALMMPAPQVFMKIMQQLGIDDHSQVVLYDRSNHAWATRVWWMLRVCGFDNAVVLNGGWQKWQAEGRDIAKGIFKFPPAAFLSVQHRPELMSNKKQVFESIDQPGTTLLHSLPLPMFTGEVAPYARAGRIPSSKNLYCETLVSPDTKCYLDMDIARERFTEMGISNTEKVIAYCGGGIAASSNAFVLSLLGVENVSIYDGSLSEWASDPDMPMEIGLA